MSAFANLVGDTVYGGEDGPRVAKATWVESSIFETLGVAAAQGRTLRPEDATSGFGPLSGGAVLCVRLSIHVSVERATPTFSTH